MTIGIKQLLVPALCAIALTACSEASTEAAPATEAAAAEPSAPAAPAVPDSPYAAEAAAEITDQNAEEKAAALEAEIQAELGALDE